jgi:hypothetical protein
VIVIKFKTKRAAERYFEYLLNRPNIVEKLKKQVAKWRAKEIMEARRRAARATRGHGLGSAHATRCSDIATGSAVTGLLGSLALFPVSGGASFVVGIGAGAVGLIADGASRAGWC